MKWRASSGNRRDLQSLEFQEFQNVVIGPQIGVNFLADGVMVNCTENPPRREDLGGFSRIHFLILMSSQTPKGSPLYNIMIKTC